ncbi:MAG TPA: hypothetical protein PKY82_16690 [Pyrinomonadaceae bacterium]|nr:hypothetical protein [Pyrinomonadaceae bacterium]
MKDFKIKYQVVNLVIAVVCGFLLASSFAWLSAADELKHPCLGFQSPCLEGYGTIFLYFLKSNLLVCLGSFFVAYVIQLVVSLRYFTKYNGIAIFPLGIIVFSLFIYFFN